MAFPAVYSYGGDGPRLLAAGWTIFLIASITTTLRFFYASKINGRWRWDFIWAATANILAIATIILYTLAILSGVGNTISKVKTTDIWNVIFYIYTCVYFGEGALTAAKLSVIALLLQIEGPLARNRRYLLFALGVTIAIFNLTLIPIAATECEPYNKLWYRLLPGSCPRTTLVNTFAAYQGYYSCITDFILALWPLSFVWDLSKPLKTKVKICLLMGVSTSAGVIAIVRIKVFPDIRHVTDLTKDYGPWLLCCCFELGFIIILSSVPTLRPLAKRICHKVTGRTGKSEPQEGGTSMKPLNHLSTTKQSGTTFVQLSVDN